MTAPGRDLRLPAAVAPLAIVVEARDDLIAFGKPFIANPDLGARLQQGGPFNPPDRATFYGGGDAGYTDYPSLTAV